MPSILVGLPQRWSMTFLRSTAFLSCSFFNSSAAFFLNRSFKRDMKNQEIIPFLYSKKKKSRTLSFFFRSGVIKPFFFLFLACASMRSRTSAFLRSISDIWLKKNIIFNKCWNFFLSILLYLVKFILLNSGFFSSKPLLYRLWKLKFSLNLHAFSKGKKTLCETSDYASPGFAGLRYMAHWRFT